MVRERGGIPAETVMGLRRRLAALPKRDTGRRAEVARIAALFGVSASTVYRALASVHRPKDLRRADRGRSRATDAVQMNRYCTIVAEKEIIVARSLSVDKQRVTLRNLIMALFLDISGDPHLKAPAQPERRERLQNDLRRATVEEIGNRTSKFDFVALGGQRREFLQWLIETCLDEDVDPDSVIEPHAQDFLVERLSAPLQFAEHLNRAFTDAFHLGTEKVTREIVESTVSAGFDNLDTKLARIGYTPKAQAERFDAHPAEIRRFLSERLDPERTAALGATLRDAGIPT